MLNIQLFSEVARNLFTSATSRTPMLGLRKSVFSDQGRRYVALEQNPSTASQWARLARQGHQVVQFKDTRSDSYVAVAVDGNITVYPERG